MRITIVTGVFSKEWTFFFYDMVKAFAGFGAEVTVIAAYPDKNENAEDWAYYREHPVLRLSEHVTVYWTGPTDHERTGLLGRALRYLYMTFAMYQKAKKTKTDVYYIYSTPPFLGYIGVKLAKSQAPTLYDAQDLFPDSLVHVKGYREESLLIRILRRLEKMVYEGNSHVNVISNDMKRTIVANGCPEEKISVIFYGANTEEIHHVDRKENRLFDEFGIPRDKFVISYGGSIRYLQRWDIVLDAAGVLEKSLPEVQFVIFGGGTTVDNLKHEIERRKISNVKLFPMLPSNRMSELYSLGDLQLVTLEKMVTHFAIPSKLWMIMSAQSPILGVLDDPSEIADIIRRNQMGYIVDAQNGADLKHAIEHIYKERDRLPSLGRNARSYVEKNHDLKTQYHKYYEVMEKLVRGKK